MAAAIPEREPTSLVAGDTATWTKSFADFPAPTWTLTYAFRIQNGLGFLNLTATASGANFSATITAAASALLPAGPWTWASYVTLGAERHQVGTGTLTIAPNLAAIDFKTDLRTSAKRAYDNALAAWETFATSKMVILNGRTYTARDAADLIKYVDRCKIDYAAELQAEAIASTGINPRKIGVRNVRL